MTTTTHHHGHHGHHDEHAHRVPAGAVTPVPPRRGRLLPAFLDALLPGLGHFVAGRRRRAALFVAPILALVALAVRRNRDLVS